MIEEQLGRPLQEVFSKISPEPVAAASLGQVYRAQLRDTGAEVAIKVQGYSSGSSWQGTPVGGSLQCGSWQRGMFLDVHHSGFLWAPRFMPWQDLAKVLATRGSPLVVAL